MASELSRLIEDELRNKGYSVDNEDEEAPEPTEPLLQPHTALMGALRVEARVKEQNAQKHLLNLKRAVCVGGGIVIVCIVWIVLVVQSNAGVATDVDQFPGMEDNKDGSGSLSGEPWAPPPPPDSGGEATADVYPPPPPPIDTTDDEDDDAAPPPPPTADALSPSPPPPSPPSPSPPQPAPSPSPSPAKQPPSPSPPQPPAPSPSPPSPPAPSPPLIPPPSPSPPAPPGPQESATRSPPSPPSVDDPEEGPLVTDDGNFPPPPSFLQGDGEQP